ncbi:homoserine dehydrogenase [Echinicola shivajiensis]|uniref:homoserine dehydrogenase n=1 Tax=Echinicola shivajiensis TaxID=1035916 RepID=UPI001BFC00E4|nr:homoserine dehydrogenase [Echinicola shivajiensis]
MAKQIGLFGFGVVGQGYYEIAQKHQQGLEPDTIVVQNPSKNRNSEISFSFEPNDILEKEIETGIELISDADKAYDYVSTLLKKGKKVISANKKMLATHLPELIQLEKDFGGSLLYEASAAAGIPVITTLDTQFAGDQIESLEGILNGSSNYILTRLFEDGLSIADAISLAQENGFAEADPSLDLNGSDVKSKLSILALHAFGQYIEEKNIATLGIQHISLEEVNLAKEFGLKIKLVAKAYRNEDGIAAYILPSLVNPKDALFMVENEYNAIKVNSINLGEQFYLGKGAGSYPTGASVYADLCKLENGYAYGYDKLNGKNPVTIVPKAVHEKVLLRAKQRSILEKFTDVESIIFRNDQYWAITPLNTASILEHESSISQEELSILAINDSLALDLLEDFLKSRVATSIS